MSTPRGASGEMPLAHGRILSTSWTAWRNSHRVGRVTGVVRTSCKDCANSSSPRAHANHLLWLSVLVNCTSADVAQGTIATGHGHDPPEAGTAFESLNSKFLLNLEDGERRRGRASATTFPESEQSAAIRL